MYFFQTATENLRCCSTASTIQHESSRQRGNGKVLESASFEIRNHNGTKMITRWNFNKLTKTRTKMEAGNLRTRVGQ